MSSWGQEYDSAAKRQELRGRVEQFGFFDKIKKAYKEGASGEGTGGGNPCNLPDSGRFGPKGACGPEHSADSAAAAKKRMADQDAEIKAAGKRKVGEVERESAQATGVRRSKIQEKYGINYPWEPVSGSDKNKYGHTADEIDNEAEEIAIQTRSESRKGFFRKVTTDPDHVYALEARIQALTEGRIASKGEIDSAVRISRNNAERAGAEAIAGLLIMKWIL